MENLILSLNIVCPVFLLILLGFFLRRRGTLSKEFCDRTSTLVFYWALPASLLKQVAGSDIISIFNLKFVLYTMLTTAALFLLAWGLSVALIHDTDQISAIVHGTYRSNFAYVGLPLISMITGKESVTAAVMVITFVVPLFNILAIPLFNHYNKAARMSFKDQALSLVKNPMIIGILLGLPFSLLRLPLPSILNTTLTNLGRTASPLGLLLIGASLRVDGLSKSWKGILLGTSLKVVAAPAVFTLLALPLHFTSDEMVTIYTLHAVPSAINSYVMTVRMGGDEDTAAGIVMATSFLSVITMTAGIFLLKQCGVA